MSLHTLYPNLVALDEVTHTYTDSEGLEYMSFSRIVNEFLCKKFDGEAISKHVARATGVSSEDVLAKWDSQRDEGTRIDNALTLYAQTGQILESDRDIEGLIKDVLKKYSKFDKTYEQLVVYDTEYRTAGSLDKLGIMGKRKDSGFKIFDFKCFEGGMTYDAKGQKWFYEPFDYLVNSRYNKISIQLSFYAKHLEKLTGRKCEGLYIDLIRPIKDGGKTVEYKNSVIPVSYQKHGVEKLLEMNKDKILNLLEPKAVEQINDDYEF